MSGGPDKPRNEYAFLLRHWTELTLNERRVLYLFARWRQLGWRRFIQGDERS